MASYGRNTQVMTKTTETETTELAMDDPRMGFAVVTDAVGTLMETVTNDQLSLPTPCTEFEVLDMLDHILLVMNRVAVIGNGGHWSDATAEQAARESGHADAFRSAAHDVMAAWTDAAKLQNSYEVPWGAMPGGPVMLTYTAELATHGWDLATAIGADFTVDDRHLGGALAAAKMLPEEGRGDDLIPFDPVVDPGADAPVLLQIAGWMGRQVI